MTEVLHVDPVNPQPDAITRAADCLRRGGLVAFPTETVYGLGAYALDRQAVLRLFEAKGRPSHDPLIVHVASVDDIEPLVDEIPSAALRLAKRFWPGPLTLVMRRAAAVPQEVTAGLETVAIRIPSHPVARALLTAAGIPIAAPSANLFSRPSPTRAAHVLEDLDGRIDMIIDGGPTQVGIESTVLDLTRGVPTVLRPGAITVDMLRTLLPTVDLSSVRQTAETATSMPSPGLLPKHYAPRAPLTLYEGDRHAVLERLVNDARQAIANRKKVGVLVAREDNGALDALRVDLRRVGSARDLPGVAAELYAALRDFDNAGVDLILVRAFPADEGLGVAIQDRLRRAAGGRIVRC